MAGIGKDLSMIQIIPALAALAVAGVASADRYHAGDELQASHDMTFYAIWRPMVYVTFSGHGDYSDGFSYYNHSILYEEHPKDGYRLVSLIVYPVNNVYARFHVL